ncbi:MAG TPA: helix-turn-helix domain-containing protein [Candidatus Baltobacteraceae bacterium]|nr:helix-turn-helix domain-containing protein [Candidatus Baltobacteraceae bacterium]
MSTHGQAINPGPGCLPVTCVSTRDVDLSDRREYWEAQSSSVFGALDIQMERDEFTANFEYTTLADVVFARLASEIPHRAIRTANLAAQDERSFVKMALVTKGLSVLEQGGRSTTLRAGEWSVYDTSKPYSMTIPNRVDMLLLLIPRDKFPTRSFDLQELVARRFTRRNGIGKLMWSLVPTTFDQIPELRRESSHDLAEIVAQMTRVALLELSDRPASLDSKEALRERVKLYIASHLGDPDLSITKLAGANGCTKRYLHMAFQSERMSISDYILRLRLERAREDLLQPASLHRSITDIAYSWGFNNSNHFSRCFKQAFGVSPRDLRLEFADWPADDSRKRQRPI